MPMSVKVPTYILAMGADTHQIVDRKTKCWRYLAVHFSSNWAQFIADYLLGYAEDSITTKKIIPANATPPYSPPQVLGVTPGEVRLVRDKSRY
jgi:aconitase A